MWYVLLGGFALCGWGVAMARHLGAREEAAEAAREIARLKSICEATKQYWELVGQLAEAKDEAESKKVELDTVHKELKRVLDTREKYHDALTTARDAIRSVV